MKMPHVLGIALILCFVPVLGTGAEKSGVVALHSSWYSEASEAFQAAREIDSSFALAYWGEAMTYDHPLWSEQDIAHDYGTLQRFLADADPDVPFLDEVRSYEPTTEDK